MPLTHALASETRTIEIAAVLTAALIQTTGTKTESDAVRMLVRVTALLTARGGAC